MELVRLWPALLVSLLPLAGNALANAPQSDSAVPDSVIAAQRAALQSNTAGRGFGPQSPRNIDSVLGENGVRFAPAPPHSEMSLCNIHFHSGAEHAGGQFTEYAGNGDGHGHHSGYHYNGTLKASELKPLSEPICAMEGNGLKPGDTIEVHYVHTTAEVEPGPTLGACLNEATKNPQLRVEAQVYVLVNDANALDFRQLSAVGKAGTRYQSLNLPDNLGKAVEYAGSTTGPGFDEHGSPYQVTWRVHPKVARVNIQTVGQWCQGNRFNEDHAHGVRNLVVNPALLSPIQ